VEFSGKHFHDRWEYVGFAQSLEFFITPIPISALGDNVTRR